MLESRATIQRDLQRLQEWVSRNLTKFSKDRCQVLCLGRKRLFSNKRLGLMGWGAALQIGEHPGHREGHQLSEAQPVDLGK